MDEQVLTDEQEIGYVISSRGYLTYLDGLPTARIADLLVSSSGVSGIVNSLGTDSVEVLLLSEGSIQPGQAFKKTGQRLGIELSDFLLGRSINPLGVAIDGKGPIGKGARAKLVDLEKEARGIETREFITSQLPTGITILDSLLPLGRGQRELILGDSHSGISNFLINLIVGQKGSNNICVYGAIGKQVTFIRNLINSLEVNKALSHTVIVASSSTETSPLIFLTPMTALSVAEYFQSQGRDVILILDDMGIHAKIYREISLLGGKSPARESYPADSFYQHAKLMERAGNFNSLAGSGSITALPVVELNLNDFTSFITTNLMSITDGHLLFKANLYNKNQRPAIDLPLSVTRVGRQTQTIVNNLLSRRIRQILSESENLETLSHFSAELPAQTQLILRQRDLIYEVLKQEDLTFIPLSLQTILLALVCTSFLKDKNEAFLRKYKITILRAFSQDADLKKITDAALSLKSDEELIKMLEAVAPRLQQICP